MFTPPLCDACGEPLPSSRGTARRTLVCPRCQAQPRAVDRARAIGPYAGSLRDIVHALKYDGRRSLARRLGDLLAVHGADIVDGADLVVPVPLHWARRRTRGFNQAAELAARLSPPVVQALARIRRTRSQAELTAGERTANVSRAFALSWQARWHIPSRLGLAHLPPLRDATAVLVDDVSTTGATLEACARVLKEAGVREVRALTVARTIARGAPTRVGPQG